MMASRPRAHHSDSSQRLWVAAVILLLALFAPGTVAADEAPAPAAPPANPTEDPRLRRGVELRTVLRDLVEQAHFAGVWPDRLAPQPDHRPQLTYRKPETILEPRLAAVMAEATVVLHERPDDPELAGGTWVGYADGHLEFAPTPADLAACLAQPQMLRDVRAARGKLFDDPGDVCPPPSERVTGRLELRIVDPDGRPVAGALIGCFGQFGDRYAPADAPRAHFAEAGGSRPVVSDARGEATVRASSIFNPNPYRFSHEPVAPLYVVHERRALVALDGVRRSEFGDATPVREIRLQPACRVRGDITSLGMRAAGRTPGGGHALAFPPGQIRLRALASDFEAPRFEFLLPPGDHAIACRVRDAFPATRYVRIEPGRRELNLFLDLNPVLTVQLLGQRAPEFRGIKAWKNSPPLKLADRRGQFVLLHFWGHWCDPRVDAMPALVKLHDEFADAGLTIIAVHDDSADSIEDLDRKLDQARKQFWAGRDLPFPVALDGGGTTRIPGTAYDARGATTAAYGIQRFPTTLLIGPDGTLLREFDVRRPEARGELEKILKAARPAAR